MNIKNITFEFSPITSLIVVIIFIISYYFLFIKKQNKKDDLKLGNITKKTDYKQIINDFEKNYFSLHSAEFLKQISTIFRSFLEEEHNYKNLSKSTLEEALKLNIDEKYYKILKNIYFQEYKETELNNKEKEKILIEVKNFILTSK